MNWKLILPVSQIAITILLCTAILMQIQGTGLGSLFGGSDSGFHTKRGAEKFLFYATIVLSVVFMVSSLVSTVLQ